MLACSCNLVDVSLQSRPSWIYLLNIQWSAITLTSPVGDVNNIDHQLYTSKLGMGFSMPTGAKGQSIQSNPTEKLMQHKLPKKINAVNKKKALEHPMHHSPPCEEPLAADQAPKPPQITIWSITHEMHRTYRSDPPRPHLTTHSTKKICCQYPGARDHSPPQTFLCFAMD